jgi:hypothetical protein
VKNSNGLINTINKNNATNSKGAITNKSSSSYCIDLFFQIGAMRSWSEDSMVKSFASAFSENPKSALKILFWARDIRQGQGERLVFKTLIKYLANNHSGWVSANIELIPHFGRWDDLLCLFETPLKDEALALIKLGLGSDPLCAKWMPREKSSKKAYASTIRGSLGISPKEYRKLLSSKTNAVESKMCSNNWDSIDYQRVPSVASLRYKNAFKRNSKEKWAKFIDDLKAGVAKVNSKALYPYQILEQIKVADDNSDIVVLESQWENLPNYLMNNPKRIMPIIDTSGSMYSPAGSNMSATCLDVAVSLGIYIAERNNGPFKDRFITFSETPSLVEIVGTNLSEKFNFISSSDWGYNTDLEAVFDLILNSANDGNVPDEDMPDTLLIISDMEFDPSRDFNDYSAIDSIRSKYDHFGYELPSIIFWNVSASISNIPVRFDESGVALVSGFSPSIMKDIVSTGTISPESIVSGVIDSERYSSVSSYT